MAAGVWEARLDGEAGLSARSVAKILDRGIRAECAGWVGQFETNHIAIERDGAIEIGDDVAEVADSAYDTRGRRSLRG